MADIIGINGLFRALPVDYLTRRGGHRPDRDGSIRANHQAVGSPGTDGVEISRLGDLLSLKAESPGLRMQRIARIRDAITGGTYETPSKIAAVVDRLLSGIKD